MRFASTLYEANKKGSTLMHERMQVHVGVRNLSPRCFSFATCSRAKCFSSRSRPIQRNAAPGLVAQASACEATSKKQLRLDVASENAVDVAVRLAAQNRCGPLPVSQALQKAAGRLVLPIDPAAAYSCGAGAGGAACSCAAGAGFSVTLIPRFAFTSTVRCISICSRSIAFSPP